MKTDVRRRFGAPALLSLVLIALGAIATTVLPPALSGQSAPSFTVHAFGGTLDPAGELPNAPILASPDVVVSYGALDPQGAIGLSLTVDAPVLPVDLRLRAARSVTGSRTGQWGCAPDEDGDPTPCPSILIEVPTDVTVGVVGLDAVYELPLGRAALRPLAGVSYVRHDYAWDPAPVGSFSLEPGSFTNGSFAFAFGATAAVVVGRVELTAEYVAHVGHEQSSRPGRIGALMFGVGVPLG